MNRAQLREQIDYFRRALDGQSGWPGFDMVLDAAEAFWATLPRTKMTEVWRVEHVDLQGSRPRPLCSTFETQAEAWTMAERFTRDGYACVHVTGPHMQEIPA